MNKKVEKAIGKALTASLAVSMVAAVPANAATATSADVLYKAAYNAVKKAETDKTQKAINEAREAIKALKGTKAAFAIGEFSKQVDKVQGPKFKAIVDGIAKAKASLKQADVDAVKALIEPELAAVFRNSYSSAADAVQATLNAKVDAAVKKAIETQAQADVDAAKALVNDVKTAKPATIVAWATAMEKKLVEGTAKVLVASVAVVDTDKVEVKFNKAVDTAKVKVELKQGSATRYTVAKWADDKKSVVLDAPSDVPAGKYNVVVTGIDKDAVTKEVEVKAAVATTIAIESGVVTKASDGRVAFKVLNQYATDMKVAGNLVTITAYNVTAKTNVVVSKETSKSEFTLDLSTNGFKVNDEIRVILTYNGVNLTKTLTAVDASGLATVALGSAVLPDKAVRFQEKQNSVKIPVVLKDQYGKDVKLTAAHIGAGLTVVSGNTSVADVSTSKVDKDGNLLVDLKAEGKVTFTAIINATGSVSTTTIDVQKEPGVDKVVIGSPTVLVANGDKVDLALNVVDQYGAEVSDTTVTYQYDGATFEAKEKNKLTVKATKEGDITVKALVGTKEVGKVTFKAEKAAEATAIVAVDATTLLEQGASTTIKAENIKVKDQYGRDYKLTAADVVKVSAVDDNGFNTVTTSTNPQIKEGVDTLVLTGTSDTANEVVKFELANKASFEVTFASVLTKDIASYELKSVATMYAGRTEAKYEKSLELVGKNAGGRTVVLVNNKITNITSSDETVIKVVSGKLQGQAKGTAKIAVWNGSTKLAETTVAVSDANPVATSLELKVDVLQATATVKDQYGVELTGTAKKGMFTSNDASIATIDSNGLITKVKTGKVTIGYVTSNGLVQTKEIEIK